MIKCRMSNNNLKRRGNIGTIVNVSVVHTEKEAPSSTEKTKVNSGKT